MAVTIKDLVERAELSRATIQRLSKSGILGTPVRKGKAYIYPDFALVICKEIKEMRGGGISLREAIGELYNERQNFLLKKLRLEIGESVGKGKMRLKNGREVDILGIYLGMILFDIDQFIEDGKKLKEISNRMRQENLIEFAIHLLQGGYNPTLMFNENEMRIIPDFLTSHYLNRDADKRNAWIVVPLLPAIKGIIKALSRGEIEPKPTAGPARKIVVKQGRDLVEYDIYLTQSGFELIESSARVINRV